MTENRDNFNETYNALIERIVNLTLEGYLLKGPEGATEKMFANIATKSFKRRFCKLRQDISGSYFLDICKEENDETTVTKIFEISRNYFISQKLVGSISVYRSVGVFMAILTI